MPLHLQSKLLRVLEDRRIEHLGGRYTIPLDVRIIAATNEDLEKKVREGGFREDLFFRINVIPFRIPSLRERKEDIPLLADHFLQLYAGKFGKAIRSIEEKASTLILDYTWPGNIRELSNAIEFAVNMEDSDILRAENLPSSVKRRSTDNSHAIMNIDQMISATLRASLEKYGYGEKGKIRTAETLGVSQATVYRWIKKYNFEKPGTK
jgi:transcriptional regulator with PAS, ATPase and Fis domain